ncbi:MAG: hypothetical protein Q8O40_06945 [Chloroflexota bacterium]|nr:hypothetical protein [Chloroflexota bacterium]
MAEEERPFCQRCQEDFPVDPRPKPDGFRMGLLRPIDSMSKHLWRKLRVVDWENPNGRYLCGNCYFDLTDEE